MDLLTKKMSECLPSLCSQKNLPLNEKIVHAKFFLPIGSWTWFAIEGEEKDRDFIFFGYIISLREGFGYFTLSDLESIKIAGVSVERDLYFQPRKFIDIIAKLGGGQMR